MLFSKLWELKSFFQDLFLGPMENRLLSNSWNTSYFLTFRFQSNYCLQKMLFYKKYVHPLFLPSYLLSPGLFQSLNILPFTNLSSWAIWIKISVFLLINVYLKIQSKFLESIDHVPIIKLCTPSIYPNPGHIADDQLIWKSISIQMDGSTSETLLSDDITV